MLKSELHTAPRSTCVSRWSSSVIEATSDHIPLPVVESRAQAWVTAIASERSLAGQPKDIVPEALSNVDF